MDVRKTLERLCLLNGPSGFEGPVADAAEELLRPTMDEVWRTHMGSVVGVRRCGKENARRILLDAHMDEIGLIVTGEKDGFLQFRCLGGVDPRMLVDREIVLLTDPERLAVTTCLPPHVQSAEDMDKSVPVDEAWIDTGLPSEEAKRLFPIGTPAVNRGAFTALGDDLVSAKALDDRSCMAAILRALELLDGKALDCDLFVLFSTQEETSGKGVVTAVNTIRPDVCVAVDVTHAVTPDTEKYRGFPLGNGPAVGIGPNAAPHLARHLLALAKRCGVKAQTEVLAGNSGTNAWPAQICLEGVLTGVVSLPLRYMHTPIEVISMADLEATAQLLAAYVACPEEVSAP